MTDAIGRLRLGDYAVKIGSGATPRGGQDVYVTTGTSLVRSQNVYINRFERAGLAFIDDVEAEKLSSVAVEAGDVLLNITGDSVARVCQAPAEILPARVNQHVMIIRTRTEELDQTFLRYYLASPQMQSYMLGLAGAGATRNALTKGMVEGFQIPDLDISIQREIARILGTLDDKIDLNRKMNATLEAMARALFKSWFVDFDPVRAKAEGRDPAGMDAETAALFPDAFEDSPLGDIPRGWRVMPLDEIANYRNGLALQKYPPTGNDYLPVIKIRELRQGYVDSSSDKASPNIIAECIVEDGDVLFSWSGSLLVDFWTGGRGALNQHLFKVTSREYPKWLYYLWTHRHLDAFIATAADKATTMGHIQRRHLSEALCVVPHFEDLQVLNRVFEPIFEQPDRSAA
ncbi:MAG: restriction endonuclease subunit S [Chloroflexi bacterium]|nr:restriction endonuclease subunit S [Chloroflexota bacterium]